MRNRTRSTLKWSGTVLTVLLLAVWIGSIWSMCTVRPPQSRVSLEVYGGILGIKIEERDIFRRDHWHWSGLHRRPATLRWGFSTVYWPLSGMPSYQLIEIPLWFLALLTAAPAVWLSYRDRRCMPGHCRKCGYDLRGADHTVCPECGSPRSA